MRANCRLRIPGRHLLDFVELFEADVDGTKQFDGAAFRRDRACGNPAFHRDAPDLGIDSRRGPVLSDLGAGESGTRGVEGLREQNDQ